LKMKHGPDKKRYAGPMWPIPVIKEEQNKNTFILYIQ